MGMLHPFLPGHPVLHSKIFVESVGRWKTKYAGSGWSVIEKLG